MKNKCSPNIGISTMLPPDKTLPSKTDVKRCFPKTPQPPTPKPDILDMADDFTTNNSIQESNSVTEDLSGSLSDVGYMSSENYNLDSSIPLSSHSSDDPFNPSIDVDPYEAQEGNDGDFILNQFDSYFRRKLEMELQTFQNCMHSMLSEQQLHFRNIITSTQQEHLDANSEELEPDDQEKRYILGKEGSVDLNAVF